jgi:hypothetical protein
MPSAELSLEVFALALEATRGTAITPPTHSMPVAGVITPVRTKYRRRRAARLRSGIDRKRCIPGRHSRYPTRFLTQTTRRSCLT